MSGVSGALMSRERFNETIVDLCNKAARRHGHEPLSDEEAGELYQQYVEGNGSLFRAREE